jgi:tetratricopeptide (TPR) repeat protein
MNALRSRWAIGGLAAALIAVAALLVVPGLFNSYGPWADDGADERVFQADPNTRQFSDEDAIAALQQRLEDNPDEFVSYLALASIYLQQVRETGDPSLYTKADGLLQRAAEIDPESGELLALQGQLALARHQFAGALEFGLKALATDSENAKYYGVVADAQIELGRYEDAVRSLQNMVDKRPDFASFSRVAYARELHGDPEGAIEALELAIGAGAPNAENVAWAYVQIGNLHLALNSPELAAKQFEMALAHQPDYPLALAGQARLQAAAGNLEEGADLYQKAFERAPLAEYAIALGDVYAAMGDDERARQQYDLVLAIDALARENGVDTELELALFLADHDIDLKESLERARSAYEARPSIHAADALAWTLYKTGAFDEAAAYAEEALRLGTREPLKLFHAGMIARAQGDSQRAEELLSQALMLDPHFSLLHEADAVAALDEVRAANDAALAAEAN